MPGEKYYNAERERQRKFLESEKKLKDNYSIIQKKYAGCPYWNKPKQNPQIDVFDLDKF